MSNAHKKKTTKFIGWEQGLDSIRPKVKRKSKRALSKLTRRENKLCFNDKGEKINYE